MRFGFNRYVAAVPEWFPTRKAAQVAAFFAEKAGGRINVLRLTKMIYLADRASMGEREFPIIGDNYVSMKHGPVNSFTYSYINGEADRDTGTWREFVGKRQGYDVPLARKINGVDDLDELSRADVRILEATWEEFKEIEKYDLAEWTHRYCPEWKDPNGSSVPIDLATIFNQLKKPQPIELAESLRAERNLKQLMAG